MAHMVVIINIYFFFLLCGTVSICNWYTYHQCLSSFFLYIYYQLDKDFTKKTSDWVDCSSIHDIEEDQDVIEKLPKNETSSKSKRSASEQMGTIYIDQNGLIVDTEAANFRWNEEFEAWLEQNVDLASGSTSVVVCITNVIFTTGLVLIMWLW